MTEVNRYHVTEAGLVEGHALGRISVVLGVDHDRVTSERDALRLDLNQRDEQIATLDLQREAHLRNSQVAERRVGVLEGLLREAKGVFAEFAGSSSIARKAFRDIDAALKPAEGGGDE